MTCEEMFKSLISYGIFSNLDTMLGVLDTICMLMFMICFFGKKGHINRKTLMPIFIFIVFEVVYFGVCLEHDYIVLRRSWNEVYQDSIYTFLNNKTYLIIGRVVYYIFVAFTAKRVFVKNWIINGIEAVVLTIAYTSYIMFETTYALAYFWGNPREAVKTMRTISTDFDQSKVSFGIYCILSFLVIILIMMAAMYFGMIKKQRAMYISIKYRLIFVAWEALMIGIHMMPFKEGLTDAGHAQYIRYELGIINPLFGLVIPFIIVAVISRRYAVEKTLVQENYIYAELDYLNHYKKKQEETRMFRYDIINNLAMLSSMYDDKKYDEAGEYLGSLLGEVSAMSPKYVTGDEMLDCIVGMKSTKMEESGIHFSVDGIVDGGLGMKPVDVCSVFANAMDNAIEACEKIPPDSDRWISLSMKKTDKFFSVKLCNTMPEDEEKSMIALKLFEDERVTTKKDKSLHGYGTQKMKATISKYDGIEKVETENGVFKLSILIPRD